MQSPVESIIRRVNEPNRVLNILTAPTHEAYQSNWAGLPYRFYLLQHKNFKPWNDTYRKLPNNHFLLDETDKQIQPDMRFDLVLSQNKFGQYQILAPIARQLNIPLISLEHTLPVPSWTQKQRMSVLQMRGDANVFISDYSIRQWGFDPTDPSVSVIKHGIMVDKFCAQGAEHNDGKILTVCNDYINRQWCCGWDIYCALDREDLHDKMNPIGDTPGFSQPAASTEELIQSYRNASVFLNTSTISPVPTALLEAMACGCPVVTTATCMIPEIVKDGINGFISNDTEYLYDKLVWCLHNPEEARAIGQKARETIVQEFNLINHVAAWHQLIRKVSKTYEG
ncbi:MAG: glycosyltransferase family 4 protein [Clostridia bacterium]|jgi:hypothetical protein